MNTPELQTMLVLSTSHLNPEMEVRVKRTYGYDLEGYGALLYCGEQALEEIVRTLPEMEELLRCAVSLGADWIKFDPDGPVMESLPVYELE